MASPLCSVYTEVGSQTNTQYIFYISQLHMNIKRKLFCMAVIKFLAHKFCAGYLLFMVLFTA